MKEVPEGRAAEASVDWGSARADPTAWSTDRVPMIAASGAVSSRFPEVAWLRVPRRIWAATRPPVSNVSRCLALYIFGAGIFHTGRSVSHRFGITAFMITLVDQAMWAVEGVGGSRRA